MHIMMDEECDEEREQENEDRCDENDDEIMDAMPIMSCLLNKD